MKDATAAAVAKLAPAGTTASSAATLGAAMDALTALKGIGPATASAIMAAVDAAGACAYLSDEAFGALREGKPKYNKDEALELMQALRAKAAQLREETGGEGGRVLGCWRGLSGLRAKAVRLKAGTVPCDRGGVVA